MKDWISVPLGKALFKSDEWIDVDPSQSYKQVTVKMWGKGVELRNEVLGSTIAASKRLQVHSEQFILSRIDARHGAFGLIPDSLNRALVTNDFPVFNLNRELLLPGFLNWLSKTASFVDICRMASEGTTNRVRLKEEKFLATEVSLPSIAEQRRIVARIEELAAKIEEARGLREEAIGQIDLIYRSALGALEQSRKNSWKQERVENVLLSIDAGWSPQCDAYPATNGQWGVLKTTSVQWNRFLPSENKALPKLFDPRPELSIKEGDVLVTRAGPRKRVGVVAAVRETQPRLMISDKLIRLRPNLSKVEARFLEISLASPLSQKHLVNRKTGLADAQVNISQAILKSTPIAYPSIAEQRQIIAYLDRIQAQSIQMKKIREHSLKEFDALLPAILDKAFKGEL